MAAILNKEDFESFKLGVLKIGLFSWFFKVKSEYIFAIILWVLDYRNNFFL